MKNKTARILAMLAIICFVLYDSVSTVLVSYSFGGFGYETSAAIRSVVNSAGILGFLLFKVVFSLVAIISGLLLVERYGYKGLGMGILAAAILAGLYAGTSNLNAVMTGATFWLFGIDSGMMCAVIIIGCVLIGLAWDGINIKNHTTKE